MDRAVRKEAGITVAKEFKDPDRNRLLRADVVDLDVLVAEALDFVLRLLLIEADLGRSHDLTATLTRGVKLYLIIIICPAGVIRTPSRLRTKVGNPQYWLPPRDSNPDMLLQRQLSYH
jgi:hypothetical protein